ncbi:SCO4225 family membrane protein [Streptomyces sp. NPDC101237]|uniref:SCO4225 family membrane protein n=1 Tax=Streptomyces sp. NPDC101237 TaxID=3366139 RepID=UPI0037F3F204
MTTGPARTLVRLTLTNRVSVAYLAVVAVVVAKAAADSPAAAEGPEQDFAWLWPPLVTFPSFPLVAALGRTAWGTTTGPTWSFAAVLAISALLQSLALGTLAQAVRTRHQRMLHSC